MNTNDMPGNEMDTTFSLSHQPHGRPDEVEDTSRHMESGIRQQGTDELMTASHASLLQLSASESSLKHSGTTDQTSVFLKSKDLPAPVTCSESSDTSTSVAKQQSPAERENINISPEPNHKSDNHGVVSHDDTTSTTADSSSNLSAEAVPLKSTTFRHLNQKYLAELEYMLCEFQKLERQLLGARNLQANESDGSRERREKLHSFILHLEDTIQQINTGCESEAKDKQTTKNKTEEESVQKLEEHILANLLPVKVRLKKQLAAQQGAKHNPAGMPVRGVVSDREAIGPKDGDAVFSTSSSGPSHFGKPLAGGGSTLTQKLHGQTLGAESRAHGHGVGSAMNDKAGRESKQILYAGMAIGSDRSQMRSSLSAASSAHRLLLQGKDVTDKIRKRAREEVQEQHVSPLIDENPQSGTTTLPADDLLPTDTSVSHAIKVTNDVDSVNSLLSAERRRIQRKKRHKRKKLLREQQFHDSQQTATGTTKRKKGTGSNRKRGPRNVEYMCALCNEVYNSTCDYNPWWALTQEECPKCGKTQIPRIDIGAPANAIEYHPALLAHADESAGAAEPSGAPTSQGSVPIPSTSGDDIDYSDVDDSDLSDEDGLLSDDSIDLESDESDSGDAENMSPAEQAEMEKFGFEYEGPKFSDSEAARLLNLILHASTCPCRHKSSDHYDVCRSVKWMMLHVRDCPGTTSTFDVCPFPWCRKTKHLLYHLVSCEFPPSCPICSTVNLNSNMKSLRGLNHFRLNKRRQCLLMEHEKLTSSDETASCTKDHQPFPKQTQAHGNESRSIMQDDLVAADSHGVEHKNITEERNELKDPPIVLSSSSHKELTDLLQAEEEHGAITLSSDDVPSCALEQDEIQTEPDGQSQDLLTREMGQTVVVKEEG